MKFYCLQKGFARFSLTWWILIVQKQYMAYLIEKPFEVAPNHVLLRIKTNFCAHPGQFVNVKTGTGYDPLLRRPFSVFNYNEGTIELIVRVVGKGTAWLKDHAQVGEIDILPPMGKGFTIIEMGSALLIGGGVGNAPLYFLAKELKKRGVFVEYVFGAKNKESIFLLDHYSKIADALHVMTEDGSYGDCGFATDCANKLISNKYNAIYTCGPFQMMALVVEMFRQSTALIEVSVEKYFGCGVGLCSGCVVETTAGNRRACIDGPVFEGRTIIWHSQR